MLSDEVFGKLSYSRLSNDKDLRAGDVVKFDDGSYGVVTDSEGDKWDDFLYVTVDSWGDILEDEGADYSDIYRVYTRYPD